MERLMCNFHYLSYYCSPNLSIHQNSTQEPTWNFLVTFIGCGRLSPPNQIYGVSNICTHTPNRDVARSENLEGGGVAPPPTSLEPRIKTIDNSIAHLIVTWDDVKLLASSCIGITIVCGLLLHEWDKRMSYKLSKLLNVKLTHILLNVHGIFFYDTIPLWNIKKKLKWWCLT